MRLQTFAITVKNRSESNDIVNESIIKRQIQDFIKQLGFDSSTIKIEVEMTFEGIRPDHQF